MLKECHEDPQFGNDLSCPGFKTGSEEENLSATVQWVGRNSRRVQAVWWSTGFRKKYKKNSACFPLIL